LGHVGYARPRSLNEALGLLAERSGARPVAGGTDLVLLMRDRVARPPLVVDISELDELRGVKSGGGGLEIGAACRMGELEKDTRVPAVLRQACAQVGTPQVRNLATIGGNVCNASPAGDTITPLLALDAVAVIRSAAIRSAAIGSAAFWSASGSPAGERLVPLSEFFLGPKKTVLRPGELLVSLRIPAAALARGGCFQKIGRRREVVISQVNVAVTVGLDGGRQDGVVETVRVALGSVAPTPLRLPEVEAMLTGQRPTPELLVQAGRAVAAEIRPISDVRTTADYRRRVAGVLCRRALQGALEEAGVVGL